MKKVLFILSLSLFSFLMFSQVPPQGMSYQAVAYNPTTNLPITDSTISLRISILENSDSGPITYMETFSETTDINGVFSLNIGMGSPITGIQFPQINWAVNNKFLRVEMIPPGGSSYVLVGTNQLMSVPYALYSKSSSASSSIATVINIGALKSFINFDKNLDVPTVYVQGYHVPGDGGGGTFIFKRYSEMFYSNPSYNNPYMINYEDYGVFFNSLDDNYKEKGVWIRQFNGEIDIRYYGASGNSQDDTEKIQNAIDYAAKSVGDVNSRPYGYNITNTVFIPNGSYKVSQLVLRTGIKIRGASKEHTSIGPTTNSDNNTPLIIIDKGPVKDVHISEISFNGIQTANNYKPCFYISGTQVEGGAGLWDSSFKNINISGFKGNSMSFIGGTGSTLANIEWGKVNQFIVFEGVYVESVGNTVNPNQYQALSISGLNAQFAFNNCRFDGGPHLYGSTSSIPTYEVSGSNVYIGVVKANDIIGPTLINFNTCTFQSGVIGINIESSNAINITGCWFENFERAITINGRYSKSKGINIMNNTFGRAAGQFGNNSIYKDTGSVIVYANAQINVLNNIMGNNGIGDEKIHFIRLESDPVTGKFYENLGANTFGNSFTDFGEAGEKQRFSVGIKKDINVTNFSGTGNNIIAENAKLIYLQNGGSVKVFNKITSLISAGELICIKASNGDIRFTETNNIYLGNMLDPVTTTHGQLTLNNGGFALFVKSDDGNFGETYNLISYKNKE